MPTDPEDIPIAATPGTEIKEQYTGRAFPDGSQAAALRR